MRLALLWLVPLGSIGLPLQPAQDGAEVVARFRCVPDEVEVGEPFALVLELEHPAGTSVFDALASDLELDDTWVILGEERLPSAPDPAAPGLHRTVRRWTLASLEPSAERPRVLSEALASLVFREDVERIETRDALVRVTSVLGDEDAPRPLPAFPPGFGAAAPVLERSPWLLPAGIGALLFWGAFLLLLVRHLRRRPAPAAVPRVPPLEELAQLEQRGGVHPDELRAKHFALTGILRRAWAPRLGEEHPGLTDAEWLALLKASRRAPTRALEELTRVFGEAEAVKYGGRAPTDWAVRETFEHARTALEAVDDSVRIRRGEEVPA